MAWIQPIDAFDLMIRGLIIGVIVSAPMGPTGVLTVQRTLNKGRWYGFATGVGAALSDILYALATGCGMSLVMDFVERPVTMFYLKCVGSVMLFLFGLYSYKSKPQPPHKPSGNKGTLASNALTGFLITFGNPLIVFLFLALMARFDFVVQDHVLEQASGYVGILGGALLWWFCLTSALNKVSSRFQMDTVGVLNRIIGILVMAASLVGLVYTIRA